MISSLIRRKRHKLYIKNYILNYLKFQKEEKQKGEKQDDQPKHQEEQLLTEGQEQITEEEEIKMFNEHKCMMQSYELLTGKKTYEELLDRDIDVMVVFNPTKPVVSMKDDVYDVLMEYFVGQEDYEKAAELRDQKLLNSYYSFPAPPVVYNDETTSSHLDENL